MNIIMHSLQSFFDKKQITYQLADSDTMVLSQYLEKANTRLNIVLYAASDNDNCIQIKIYNLCKANYTTEAVLRKINELNLRYRWYCLALEDEDIVLSTDAIVTPNNVGDICLELVLRGLNISEEIYPEIMRAIWG